MKQRVYAIFDAAAAAYLPPFMMPRDELALRAFKECVNSPTHQFGVHPQDYTLFFIGTFEDTEARYTQPQAYIALAQAIALKAQKPDQDQLPLINQENC